MSQLYTSKKPEHYTPAPYVTAGQRVLGVIDLDPASSPKANRMVRATRFYRVRGESRPWSGRVYCNPPGDARGILVMAFWIKANEHAFSDPEHAVLWAGFNVNTRPRLARGDAMVDGRRCPGPLDWPHVEIGPGAPCATAGGRICWIDGDSGEPGRQPGHGNYFCLLGGDYSMTKRFKKLFGSWGAFTPGLREPGRDLDAEIRAALRPRPLSRRAVLDRLPRKRNEVLAMIHSMLACGAITVGHDGLLVLPGVGNTTRIRMSS